MTEEEYWIALEFRLSREFPGMSDRFLRSIWCDGFLPSDYFLDDDKPRITGRVWMVFGQDQKNWGFELILPRPYSHLEDINWQELLPTTDVTRWISLDFHSKRIEIEPSVAVPDL